MKNRYLLVTAALALCGTAASAQDYCREYTKGVVIGGVRQSGYGTACLMPDGAWRITQASDGYMRPAAQIIPPQQVITTSNYVQPVMQPTYFYPPQPVYYQRPYYYNPFRTNVISLSFNSHSYRPYHPAANHWDNHHDNGHHNSWHH